jgi:hypothetical protein
MDMNSPKDTQPSPDLPPTYPYIYVCTRICEKTLPKKGIRIPTLCDVVSCVCVEEVLGSFERSARSEQACSP